MLHKHKLEILTHLSKYQRRKVENFNELPDMLKAHRYLNVMR